MKFKLVIGVLLILFMHTVKAQGKVGINTDEPTRTMDVNGEVRIRDIEQQAEGDNIKNLIVNYDGTIGEIKYDFETANMVVATGPVVETVSEKGEKDDIDLNMSIKVTIPARREANIFIFYSVPIGIDFSDDLSSNHFYGVRLLKTVEGGVTEEHIEAGDVLFRATKIGYKDEDLSNDNVVSAAKNYAEKVTNNTNSPMVITYSLKGVVWQAEAVRTKYRFNMFKGENKENTGKSVLISQVYVNKLD